MLAAYFSGFDALVRAVCVRAVLPCAYPFAQGMVYLRLPRRVANRLTAATLPVLLAMESLVVLSPLRVQVPEPHVPGGATFEWNLVRGFRFLSGGYAAVVLIGGAIWSAWRRRRDRSAGAFAFGNASMAFGAVLASVCFEALPPLGGDVLAPGVNFAALYAGEFVGLLFIWLGYALCVRRGG
jgi:hypothetical protein